MDEGSPRGKNMSPKPHARPLCQSPTWTVTYFDVLVLAILHAVVDVLKGHTHSILIRPIKRHESHQPVIVNLHRQMVCATVCS